MPRKKKVIVEAVEEKVNAAPANTEDQFLEKRKTARLDIPIKVQYRPIDEELPREAVTKNISAGGCLLLATENLRVGSDVELNVQLGDSESEALLLRGNIIRLNRAERGLYEFGIAFNNMSREARRLFADFCFAKMYEMIGLSEWPTDKRQKGGI